MHNAFPTLSLFQFLPVINCSLVSRVSQNRDILDLYVHIRKVYFHFDFSMIYNSPEQLVLNIGHCCVSQIILCYELTVLIFSIKKDFESMLCVP